MHITFQKINIDLFSVIPNIFILAQVSDASLRLFILPIFPGLYFTGLSFISKMNYKIICCPHVTPQGLFLGTGEGELIAITSFCKNLLFAQIK